MYNLKSRHVGPGMIPTYLQPRLCGSRHRKHCPKGRKKAPGRGVGEKMERFFGEEMDLGWFRMI